MAGGHYRSVKIDPAIERWQNMHNTMYQRFRWTPKNAPSILFWGIGVPTLTFLAISNTNYRWEFGGKRKDESLLREAPAADA
ncbi:mitochondrial protein [Malassezia pachydermatis]|uniref:NADH dehydrogenase [ubiquinone] 1 beta subcomplex subunit 4 n=1 Tax=Malassezia pachydermatis TaxID=77020 RepID=A0A0M9VN00_9BASI|nr:nadh-ubiquinone oxidoreductase subunit [Malassezia pachydermatis]KOS12773.1 nadh-ubiquinone oxidoreductase subunit [Malassezia pachydermatis]